MVLSFCGRFLKAEDVIQSISPLTFASWLSVAPFQLSLYGEKRVRASYVFLIGFISYLYYVCYTTVHWEHSPIKYTGIISMSIIFGFAFFKRQKLTDIVQNIIIVDENLARLGVKINYKRVALFSFLATTGIIIFIVIYLFFGFNTYEKGISLEVAVFYLTIYALPHINITLMILKFLCFNRLVQSRFIMINELLQDILDVRTEHNSNQEVTPIPSNGNFIVHQNPEKAVEQVSSAHNLLCDICETIGEYFSFPMLATIGVSFLFMVIKAYYILVILYHQRDLDYSKKYDYLASEAIELIIYIVIIFLIVEASSITIGHSSFSATIIHKILNINIYNDVELKDRLNRFSLQLIHRKVNFSAAGMLSLNRELILTIAGTTTCYLIILLQSRPDNLVFETQDSL